MSGRDGDAAVFFGLSGTGKTTLSADPSAHADRRRRARLVGRRHLQLRGRLLRQDHPACREEAEPEIYATTSRFGTVLENVVLDPVTARARLRRRPPDREHPLRLSARLHLQRQPDRHRPAIPQNIVMLTADAFGVLPPIAQADARARRCTISCPATPRKVAGTEKGVAPSRRRPSRPASALRSCRAIPAVYGKLLRELIAKHDVDCWLVNTGWTGGATAPAGACRSRRRARCSTRRCRARSKDQPMRTDPLFGFQVPTALPGVEPAHPQSARDLGRQGRLRRAGARAGRHVQQELRQVRGPRRRRRQGRRPGAAAGGGMTLFFVRDTLPQRATLACLKSSS